MARYEFRIFRKNLGKVEINLQNYMPPGEITDSSEIYIVSNYTDETNVKLRDEALEIKELVQRWFGLEQWQPVSKTTFPLPADLLAKELFPRLAIKTPSLKRNFYSFDQFLAELIQPQPDLFLVQVAKLRQKFTVENCQAELSEVMIEGDPWRTVAVEGEDPQAVLRAQAALGLTDYENINYVKAIKQVLSFSYL